MFFIKDEKFITVEKMGDRDASYDDFLTDLQSGGEGECRYGLYDFEYEHQCQVSRDRMYAMMKQISIFVFREQLRAPRNRNCS